MKTTPPITVTASFVLTSCLQFDYNLVYLLCNTINEDHESNSNYAENVKFWARIVLSESDVRHLYVDRLVDAHDKEPAKVHHKIYLAIALAVLS